MTNEAAFLEKFAKKVNLDHIQNEINEILRKFSKSYIYHLAYQRFIDEGIIFDDIYFNEVRETYGMIPTHLHYLIHFPVDRYLKLSSQIQNSDYKLLFDKYIVHKVFQSSIKIGKVLDIEVNTSSDNFISQMKEKYNHIRENHDIFVQFPLPFASASSNELNELADDSFWGIFSLLGCIEAFKEKKTIIDENIYFNSIFSFGRFLFKNYFDFNSNSELYFESFRFRHEPYNIAAKFVLNEMLTIIKNETEYELDLDLDSFDDEDDVTNFLKVFNKALYSLADEKNIFWDSSEEDFPIGLFNIYNHMENSDYEENNTVDEIIPPIATDKSSSAILEFFNANSNTLISKLKDSGVMLSVSALQNDQNISRVANVVYGLLPAMVRIFVNRDTIEKFLIENRQWLINKLV